MAVLAAVAIACVCAFGAPGRADAHGVGGTKPRNYRTQVLPGSPGIPGVTVRSIDLGDRLELTNRSAATITVLGYEGEPYLRIGPDGTFENVRSPATAINKTVTPTGPPPATADPAAAPEWHKVSDAPVARWHDHRAHWLGGEPAVVRNEPNQRHVVMRWNVPLLRDGAPAPAIEGTVTWIPPTSPWPWVLGALAMTVTLTILVRTRVWRAAWMVALVGIAASEIAAMIGTFQFSTASFVQRGFANVYNFAGLVLAIATLAVVARKTRSGATPMVLVTGLVVFVGTGIPGFIELSASELPTSLPTAIGRMLVMSALGLGLGLAVGAAQFLREPGTSALAPATTAPRTAPTEEESCPSAEVSPPSPSA